MKNQKKAVKSGEELQILSVDEERRRTDTMALVRETYTCTRAVNGMKAVSDRT